MQNTTVNLTVNFINDKMQRLTGILSYPADANKSQLMPAVILCHGFMDSKNKLKYLARYFYSQGYATLRFDYANTGESDGKLENLTISQQVLDLNSALNFISKLKFVDKDRIGVIGYSYGGMVAILQAVKDSRIKCLGILAGVIEPQNTMKNIIPNKKIERWNVDGYIPLQKFSSLKKFTLKIEFLKDAYGYDVLDNIAKIRIPLIFILGENDRVISKSQMLNAYAKANEPKNLYLLKFCGHAFLNPFSRRSVCKRFGIWFKRWL